MLATCRFDALPSGRRADQHARTVRLLEAAFRCQLRAVVAATQHHDALTRIRAFDLPSDQIDRAQIGREDDDPFRWILFPQSSQCAQQLLDLGLAGVGEAREQVPNPEPFFGQRQTDRRRDRLFAGGCGVLASAGVRRRGEVVLLDALEQTDSQVRKNGVDTTSGNSVVPRDTVLVVNEVADLVVKAIAGVNVERLVGDDRLVERQHHQAASQCPAYGSETRRGDLLKDRHHESERTALVALPFR